MAHPAAVGHEAVALIRLSGGVESRRGPHTHTLRVPLSDTRPSQQTGCRHIAAHAASQRAVGVVQASGRALSASARPRKELGPQPLVPLALRYVVAAAAGSEGASAESPEDDFQILATPRSAASFFEDQSSPPDSPPTTASPPGNPFGSPPPSPSGSVPEGGDPMPMAMGAAMGGPMGSARPGPDVPQAPQEVQLLMCLQTEFAPVVVLEIPDNPAAFGAGLAGCRILKLDTSNNVHSIYHPTNIWTDSYWDELASVAAISPPRGSVGILGLGAGTVPRIVRELRPEALMEGWEIDKMVAEIGRDFFFMKELEEPSAEGGKLVVHIADAFDAKSADLEGFSCLVVDLFGDGKLLQQLTSPDTWAAFRGRLAPAGRVVANLGGPSLEPALAETDEAWQATIAAARAVAQAFPGEAFYRRSDELSQDSNYLVMTGPPYDEAEWASRLPDFMGDALHLWKPLTMDAECFKR